MLHCALTLVFFELLPATSAPQIAVKLHLSLRPAFGRRALLPLPLSFTRAQASHIGRALTLLSHQSRPPFVTSPQARPACLADTLHTWLANISDLTEPLPLRGCLLAARQDAFFLNLRFDTGGAASAHETASAAFYLRSSHAGALGKALRAKTRPRTHP